MTARDRTELAAQLLLLDRPFGTRRALGGTVLTDDATREAFGDPEALLQAAHRPPASLRG